MAARIKVDDLTLVHPAGGIKRTFGPATKIIRALPFLKKVGRHADSIFTVLVSAVLEFFRWSHSSGQQW